VSHQLVLIPKGCRTLKRQILQTDRDIDFSNLIYRSVRNDREKNPILQSDPLYVKVNKSSRSYDAEYKYFNYMYVEEYLYGENKITNDIRKIYKERLVAIIQGR
jgi:hypothetical protein